MESNSAKVRAEAARVVARVMRGASLDDALAAIDTQGMSAQNLSLLKALAYGVVREHGLLAALAAQMLEKPLDQEPELHALLLTGLHQLRSMRMPPFAAVDETVNAIALLKKSWARGLTNAVLRRYQREARALEDRLPNDPATRYSYPLWLMKAAQKDWPQRWKTVLTAGNEQGPLTLRLNRRRTTPQDYAQRLAAAGVTARPLPGVPDAVILDTPVPVEKIPGFAEGLVSVQDAAAQLAAPLLDAKPGQRVLDACAAPGGKTAHLLERADLDLLALDTDPQRLERVSENLSRLGLSARLAAGDAGLPKDWWDGNPYDRILLDAPCSGTGVIRRHPDIKWLRRANDIPRMAQEQLRLLAALWPLLAPGGLLLYATCSILGAEGTEVVRRFLEAHPDAQDAPIAADWGEACTHGRRLPPGGAFDGFYYACIVKRS